MSPVPHPPPTMKRVHTDYICSKFSAGGGGAKSETRKTRIVEKNKKLGEQRARSAAEAAKQKRIEEKKSGQKQKPQQEEGSGDGEAAFADIHPSRRNQMAI